MRRIGTAVELYRMDVGALPSNDAGLRALIEATPLARVGYLKAGDLLDEWGEELVYRVPSRHPTLAFDLYSKGANRVDDAGSYDDITYAWGVPWRHYPWLDCQFMMLAVPVTLLGVLLVVLWGIVRVWRSSRRRPGRA